MSWVKIRGGNYRTGALSDPTPRDYFARRGTDPVERNPGETNYNVKIVGDYCFSINSGCTAGGQWWMWKYNVNHNSYTPEQLKQGNGLPAGSGNVLASWILSTSNTWQFANVSRHDPNVTAHRRVNVNGTTVTIADASPQHSVPNLFTGAHVIVFVQTACAAGETSCSIPWDTGWQPCNCANQQIRVARPETVTEPQCGGATCESVYGAVKAGASDPYGLSSGTYYQIQDCPADQQTTGCPILWQTGNDWDDASCPETKRAPPEYTKDLEACCKTHYEARGITLTWGSNGANGQWSATRPCNPVVTTTTPAATPAAAPAAAAPAAAAATDDDDDDEADWIDWVFDNWIIVAIIIVVLLLLLKMSGSRRRY